MKQFLRITAAVLAAAFLFALTGCSGGSGAASFTWFVDTIPANLDPQVVSAAPDVIACENLYGGLVRKTPTARSYLTCAKAGPSLRMAAPTPLP